MLVSNQQPLRQSTRVLPRYKKDIIKEKRSVGLACCRFKNGPEILLVCKRLTYSFIVFVYGTYAKNTESILKLLNGMTVDEKYEIMSLTFQTLWFKLRLDHSHNGSGFYAAKNKYESTFVADGGEYLRKLLSMSTHSQRLWEIPKGGKKDKFEDDISCAIREFQEETGLSKTAYKILPHTRRHTHVDERVRYTNEYYLALMTQDVAPRLNFQSITQIKEICEIRWAGIEDMRVMDPTGHLESFVKPIFKFMKSHVV